MKVLYKHDIVFASYQSKSIAYQTIVRNLISSVWIHYETAPMPLMRIQVLHLDENWFRIGKGLLSSISWSMYPHLTNENLRNILRSGVLTVLCSNTTDNQSSLEWRTAQLRRVGGVSETLQRFYFTNSQKQVNIHQSNWLTKWILCFSQPLQIYRWYCLVRIWAYNGRPNQARSFQSLFRCTFWGLWHLINRAFC